MPESTSGCYYATADLIGLSRRLLIDCVDGMVLLVIWGIAYAVILALHTTPEQSNALLFAAVLGSSFLYLVLLKYFARSLGYVMVGARLANWYGLSPSIGALTIRALFLFIGPGNMLLDLVWLTGDPHRQAIRDKFARTYVIRRNSTPQGTGRVRYVRLDMLGYQFLYPEVTRNPETPALT